MKVTQKWIIKEQKEENEFELLEEILNFCLSLVEDFALEIEEELC